MIGTPEVEHGVTQYEHQFFVLASKSSSKRVVLRLYNDIFSDPLPELSLRCPERLTVPADYQSRFFLLLFLFISTHVLLASL